MGAYERHQTFADCLRSLAFPQKRPRLGHGPRNRSCYGRGIIELLSSLYSQDDGVGQDPGWGFATIGRRVEDDRLMM